jgi:ATP-dependent RNA helicase HelY
VVTLDRQLERDRAYLEGYRHSMRCDRGDFAEYWALRQRAERIRQDARRGRERASEEAVRGSLMSLRPGDVIFVPSVRRRGLGVVLANREGRPTVLTQERRAYRLGPSDFDGPPQAVARIELPRSGSARSARYRRDLAAQLVALRVRRPAPRRESVDAAAEQRAAQLERKAGRHPCHSCPDRSQHERWATRATRLERELAGLERRIRSRTETLGRQFDRVLAVLSELGYVEDGLLTEKGERLRRVYSEGDILVAEALSDGLFGGLSPSEFAALTSTAVYESRERVPRRSDFPTSAVRTRFRALSEVWSEIRRIEDEHQVELCRELDPGFVPVVFAWAEGKPLDDVLEISGMAAGDFVRNCKQLLDLLRQIEDVADPEVAVVARAAHDAVNRSVVAYTGL